MTGVWLALITVAALALLRGGLHDIRHPRDLARVKAAEQGGSAANWEAYARSIGWVQVSLSAWGWVIVVSALWFEVR